MKTASIILLLFIFSLKSHAQTDPNKELIQGFVSDLKANEMSSLELLEKYYFFHDDSILAQKRMPKDVLPLFVHHYDVLREKLFGDCAELEIIRHNSDSDMIKAYKLRHDDFTNVYYIVCNKPILVPVWVHKNKKLSTVAHYNNKNGPKGFAIFY